MIAFFILLLAAAFVDYSSILGFRLEWFNFPINIVDVAGCIAFPFLFEASRKASIGAMLFGKDLFAVHLMVLAFLAILGAIYGMITGNPLYDILRDLRSIFYLCLSYLLALKYCRSQRILKTVINIIILGGIWGGFWLMVNRTPSATYAESYREVRGIGGDTASAEITRVLLFALVFGGIRVCGWKMITWCLLFATLVPALLSLNLTVYATLILIPAMTLLLAQIPLRRKVIVGLSTIVGVLAIYYSSLVGVGGGQGLGNLLSLISQPLRQLIDLSGSVHLTGRKVSWEETFDYLGDEFHYVVGRGLGNHVLIDTGIEHVGTVTLGEPTYSTYLLNMGIIGVMVLMALHVRFAFVCYQKMKSARSVYFKSVLLGLAVYGTLVIMNSFLHNNFMSPLLSVIYGVLLGLVQVYREVPEMVDTRLKELNPENVPRIALTKELTAGRQW